MDVNFNQTLGPNFASKMKSTRNLSIEIVLLIIFGILFYWFLILPKQTFVNTQTDDLAKLKGQESRMSGALDDLKNLVSTVQSDQSDVTLLDQAMPLENRLNYLQQLLQNMADSAGLAVGSIDVAGNPNGVVAGDKTLLNNPYGATRKLQVVNASVFVSGTLPQLEEYIKKVENSARIMDINTLTIDSGTNGNLNMRITLKAYYLGPY